MKSNLKLAQRLLRVVPLVTGSVLISLPSFAGTLSTANAEITFSNFSQNPVFATNNQTQILAEEGQVSIDPVANATFNSNGGTAFSKVKVEGNSFGYLGSADSTAQFQSNAFSVAQNQEFSFNFNGLLNLNTSIDSPEEATNATGTIAFQLYEITDTNTEILLDYFTVTGSLNSSDNSDYLLSPFNSFNITLTSSETTAFGGNDESATSSFAGTFKRLFTRATNLVVRGFTYSKASTSCPAR
ncbi:MAG TPA: hypothetical protein V6C91_09755 [Coleofasciculaceae cyanobacterium]